MFPLLCVSGVHSLLYYARLYQSLILILYQIVHSVLICIFLLKFCNQKKKKMPEGYLYFDNVPYTT